MASQPVDDLDRELLNAVQWDFPLGPRPYAQLAERLAITEPEVRERVQRVKDAGVLRQLSAIFDTRALGYSSALVAGIILTELGMSGAEAVSRLRERRPGALFNERFAAYLESLTLGGRRP